MKLLKCVLLTFAVAFFSLSCDQQKIAWQGTVEDVEGVTVVHNPVDPMVEDGLELEEELSIGEADGAEEYLFADVKSVAVDDSDKIYVLDSKQAHIKVFDKAGNYLKTIGKKGQGPEEFQGPRDLIITSQHEILVNDLRARQLKFFSMEGSYQRQFSLSKYFAFLKPQVDGSGEILAVIGGMGENGTITETLQKFTKELVDIFSVSSKESIKFPVIKPFFPRHHGAFNSKDQIVWGIPFEYEFHILEPNGTLISTITKKYDPVPITKEDKDKWMTSSYGGAQHVPSSIKLDFGEYHNAYQHISIDEQDRVFIQTYEIDIETGRHYFDVFDSEGRYITRILLKSPPQVWKNNKLYTIEEDEDGFQYVKRYNVSWKL